MGRNEGGGLCCERYDEDRLETASKLVEAEAFVEESVEVDSSTRELDSRSPAEESKALRRLSALPM